MRDENVFKNHLQAQGKLNYAKGKNKPNVECILCAIRDNNEEVKKFIIYQDEIAIICLNLYPYNPGHLMVFPKRHITDYRDLDEKEIVNISYLIKKCQNMLDELFEPTGYNIGLNIGEFSGASISHLHYHIVPRYPRELGYIDIIGNSRVVVEGVSDVYKKIMSNINKYFK